MLGFPVYNSGAEAEETELLEIHSSQPSAPPATIGAPSSPSADAKAAADKSGSSVAMSMWLGVALDGIPEALMLGFAQRPLRLRRYT